MKRPSELDRPRVQTPRAFTLIELLTVVAIIGILAAILIPVVGKAREQAHIAACRSNLRQIGVAIYMYALDHNENLPRRRPGQSGSTVRTHIQDSLGGLLIEPPVGWGPSNYLDTADILFCPRNNHPRFQQVAPGRFTWDNNMGYGWYYITGAPEVDNTSLREDNHNHIIVSDLDGRRAWMDDGWAPHPPVINFLRLGGHVTSLQQDWIVNNSLHTSSLAAFVEAVNAR